MQERVAVGRLRDIHRALVAEAAVTSDLRFYLRPIDEILSEVRDLSSTELATLTKVLEGTERDLRDTGIPLQRMVDHVSTQAFDWLAAHGVDLGVPVYVGSYPTMEYNAVTIPTTAGMLILVDVGLFSFPRQVIGMFCLAGDLASRVGGEKFSVPAPTGEEVDQLRNLFESYMPDRKRDIWHPNLPWLAIPELEVAAIAYVFVILHEIAHVALGHVQTAARRALTLSSGRCEPCTSVRHEQELAADRLALEWLMGGVIPSWELRSGDDASRASQTLLTAPVLCLYLHEALIIVQESWGVLPLRFASESHPRSSERGGAILKAMNEMCLPVPYLCHLLVDWLLDTAWALTLAKR